MTPDELALALEEKRPEMLRVARHYLLYQGLADEAEDFVQEAMLKILQYKEEPTNLPGLFRDALKHLIFNRLDKEQRRHPEGKDVTHSEYTAVFQPDSQAQIKQRERLKLDVSLAMDRLPDDQTRQIVRLIWMEDHNYRQVKKQLKITGQTIIDALDVARPILQKELARYDHRQRRPSVPAEDRTGLVHHPVSYEQASHVSLVPAPLSIPGAETDSVETGESGKTIPALALPLWPADWAA